MGRKQKANKGGSKKVLRRPTPSGSNKSSSSLLLALGIVGAVLAVGAGYALTSSSGGSDSADDASYTAQPGDESLVTEVEVRTSGQHMGTPGRMVNLTMSHPGLSHEGGAAKKVLYDSFGQRVTRRHLQQGKIAAGAPLFEVPTDPGLHWMWPLADIGHRFKVPGVKNVGGKAVELEMLNQDPRVFYVHNFMSKKETDWLKSWAEDERNPYKMAPSTVGTESWDRLKDRTTSKDSTRTSENAFDINSKVAFAIKKRAFKLLRIPYQEDHADGIQVLRYNLGQAYIPHTDYFDANTQGVDKFNWDSSAGGSNRFATLFLYLSDVEEGGQTVFPRAERLTNSSQSRDLEDEMAVDPVKLTEDMGFAAGSWQNDMVKKCYSKFSVYPKAGNAVLFYSQHPDGRLNPMSQHGGCPVLKGQKWAANLWVWNKCRYGVKCGSG